MFYQKEKARNQSKTAKGLLKEIFPIQADFGEMDGEFSEGNRKVVIGFAGLPYEAPVVMHLLGEASLQKFFLEYPCNMVFWNHEGKICCFNEKGEVTLPEGIQKTIGEIYSRVIRSPGYIDEKGQLVLNLKSYPVGPHYPVNLLLGNRIGYEYPLCTTPKSALDALGRGSFRSTGGKQVLATRCVLDLKENGEPQNRQFYLVEDGKQIFYSANVHENVAEATCVHSQNRTIITYITECGLKIIRTIFLLPQEDGMPNAVEVQHVEIQNQREKQRNLKIIFTGMFGITGPETIANDVVFANIVVESEVLYDQEKPIVMSLHHKPWENRGDKRFALLLCNGETMDEFCTSLDDFVGNQTLYHPELLHLPNHYSRKMTPFFAMAKSFSLAGNSGIEIDSFVGILEENDNTDEAFDCAIHQLVEHYRVKGALKETYEKVLEFWKRYSSYLIPDTGDTAFDIYTANNLPFQVLYQTYVSRAFAWTQKSYRETGFREIQDIYASMYYIDAMGDSDLIKNLISNWIRNVFRMGYANHDFTFQGKAPGDCSDDQLWLVQAVYRYVNLTGDDLFLLEEYPIAGEDTQRTLWDTLQAILVYSGKISVGIHGLPLLDKADWNDTLRLDRTVMQGPEKESRYMAQLREKGQSYGVPFENTYCESVMNACLLVIAANEVAQMAERIGKTEDEINARKLADHIVSQMQTFAWKGDFFARCLINDGREGGYTYLGAGKDGLALEEGMDGSYFLNSYSWSILAEIATEEQIRIMLDKVQQYLRTEAGLRLCTLVNFDRLGVETGTALYFPGDRENGGVFKHAAMMAATASLKAAKQVKDESLAKELLELAFFMIHKTVPYRTMENPFIIKGNPRFCTQYNNSETGENIGPMLSGTSSWLTLALYEYFGIQTKGDELIFTPVLAAGQRKIRYQLRWEETVLMVEVTGDESHFRTGTGTEFFMDGVKVSSHIKKPGDGKYHKLEIRL